MIRLTLDGSPAGECNEDDFELAKMMLRDGTEKPDVVRALKAAGYPGFRAIAIVVNADRANREEKGR